MSVLDTVVGPLGAPSLVVLTLASASTVLVRSKSKVLRRGNASRSESETLALAARIIQLQCRTAPSLVHQRGDGKQEIRYQQLLEKIRRFTLVVVDVAVIDDGHLVDEIREYRHRLWTVARAVRSPGAEIPPQDELYRAVNDLIGSGNRCLALIHELREGRVRFFLRSLFPRSRFGRKSVQGQDVMPLLE
jgi:hypothetical protein